MGIDKKSFLKRFKEKPVRVKRASTGRKDSFVDRDIEHLAAQAYESEAERAFLEWYSQATSPGYPGPDIGCRSTLDPRVLWATTGNKRKGKRS